MDVDTGKLTGLEIPNTPQGVQWLPDGSGFVYQQLKDAKDPASQQSRFHRLGTPPASDPVLARAPFIRLSRDGRWIVLGYPTGPASNDLWLASFASARKGGAVSLSPKAVSVGQQGRIAGGVVDDTLFLHTTQGAPNGRVVAVSTADPGPAKWREIVPGTTRRRRRERRVHARARRRHVPGERLERHRGLRHDGRVARRGAAAGHWPGEPDGRRGPHRSVRVVHQLQLSADGVQDRPRRNPSASPTRWASPDVAVDPASVEVERVSYASKDGTQITMFVVRKAGFVPAGDAPALIVAHGALGTSMAPAFTASFFPWFDAGGVLAVPHLRGGGEYGDAWHRAAMREKKQTAVDDLLAAADWLIANRYTRADRLALTGGAHGGLTAAIAMIQQPDRFRAVVLTSPLADMLRFHRFGFGPYWVPEYGSADDPAQATWLRAYSPYQRVVAGTKYPAVFITAPGGRWARACDARAQAGGRAAGSERVGPGRAARADPGRSCRGQWTGRRRGPAPDGSRRSTRVSRLAAGGEIGQTVDRGRFDAGTTPVDPRSFRRAEPAMSHCATASQSCIDLPKGLGYNPMESVPHLRVWLDKARVRGFFPCS